MERGEGLQGYGDVEYRDAERDRTGWTMVSSTCEEGEVSETHLIMCRTDTMDCRNATIVLSQKMSGYKRKRMSRRLRMMMTGKSVSLRIP